jgi:hypothetical protein
MKILYTALLFLLVSNLFAQTDCSCCDTFHKQFDFWIGDWTVLDTLGNKVGENQISKIEDNCIVLEHWKGAKGGTGTSMNYYDNSDSTWNQLWVDNKGSILKLKGRFTSGQMVLKSDMIKGQKVDYYYNQITWSQNEDGTVTQLWEIYDNTDKLLKMLFKGIYNKKN